MKEENRIWQEDIGLIINNDQQMLKEVRELKAVADRLPQGRDVSPSDRPHHTTPPTRRKHMIIAMRDQMRTLADPSRTQRSWCDVRSSRPYNDAIGFKVWP